jgi:rubrerythrin
VRLPLLTQQQNEHPLQGIQRFFDMAANAAHLPGDALSANFTPNLPPLATPQHSIVRPFSQQGAQLFNNSELTPQSRTPHSYRFTDPIEQRERDTEVSTAPHATVTLTDILDEMGDGRTAVGDWETDAKEDLHDKFDLDVDVAHGCVLSLRDAFCAVNSDLMDTTQVLAEKKRMLSKVNRHLNKLDELRALGDDDEAAQECFNAAHASMDALKEASSNKVEAAKQDALALKKQIYVLQRCLQETHDMQPRPQCPICMEHPAAKVCIPCGHVLCEGCASHLSNGETSRRGAFCYTCRAGVHSMHRVYF